MAASQVINRNLFYFLVVFLIVNVVNCMAKDDSKKVSSFRSAAGREINAENEPSSRTHNGHTESSTNSKYSSAIQSPITGSDGSGAFVPSYYEYQHAAAVASSTPPSPVYQYVPQHLQYYNAHYPYNRQSYSYPPESTYSARQLRYSDYLTEAVPLYNSLSAIEKEKDLVGSGASHHGWHHGWHSDEHEHDEYGHGHGKGWKKGWKKGKKKHTSYTSHTDYKVSAVNTDGLGLLGLLGLLSLFQFALLALTTTTTTAAPAGGRRKRGIGESSEDDTVVVAGSSEPHTIDSLSQIVLPSLNVVAHARNGQIPLNCTYQEVCRANQLIVKNLEIGGTIVGMRITDGIIEMLQFLDDTPDKSLLKQLKEASLKGRNGEICEKHYPTCKELRKPGGPYSLPLLLPVSHPYYYNNSQKIKIKSGNS